MRKLKILQMRASCYFLGNQDCGAWSFTKKKKKRKDVTMRKVCFLLTALLLVSPAFALDVDCSIDDPEGDPCLVTVYYANAEEANLPRAFGLDITVDNGATIDSLEDYDDTNFWVYPGNIVIDGNSVTEPNEPIAKFQVAGREEEGVDTSGITIEMGSLYNDPCDPEHQSPPPLSGMLVKFRVSGDCNVAIAANAARGGVVLENPDIAADANFGGCQVVAEVECFDSGHADYAEWVTVGRPTSWCYKYQCLGNASGEEQGDPKTGYYRVGNPDLNILLDGWQKEYLGDPEAQPWIAANISRELQGDPKTGYYRVGNADLNIMLEYWQVKVEDLPAEPDCGGDLLEPVE
jgi:hypothetical protein